MSRLRKHLSYAGYVLLHKARVFEECLLLRVPLRGLLHDLSKLLPSEWEPYADYTFGELCEQDRDAYEAAMLQHHHRNPHHYQHWTLHLDNGQSRPLPIPEEYVREMLADWRASGRAPDKVSLCEWLREHARNIELNVVTEMRLERLMTVAEWNAWHEGKARKS